MKMMALPGIAFALCLAAFSPQANAQWAVVDAGAIAQLVEQVTTLKQQLETAQGHLAQAQQAYQSMTGPRGMERLLSGTARNYLPADWRQLEDLFKSASGAFQSMSAELRAAMDKAGVLTPDQLAALSPAERAQVEDARRSAAMLQVTTRKALETTSQRFASIQQLIDAIPSATDEKGILDLQARIQAEQGMLTNEATKLQMLFQTAQAEEWAREQRALEQGVEDIGSLRRLPAMNL